MSDKIGPHIEKFEITLILLGVILVLTILLTFVSLVFLFSGLILAICCIIQLSKKVYLTQSDEKLAKQYAEDIFPEIVKYVPQFKMRTSYMGIVSENPFLVIDGVKKLIISSDTYWLLCGQKAINGPIRDIKIIASITSSQTSSPQKHHEIISSTWLHAKRTNQNEPDLRFNNNYKIFTVSYYELYLDIQGKSWKCGETAKANLPYLYRAFDLLQNPLTPPQTLPNNNEYFSMPSYRKKAERTRKKLNKTMNP